MSRSIKRVCLAWTGASGFIYGWSLLSELLIRQIDVELVYTEAAQVVAQQEFSLKINSDRQQCQQTISELLKQKYPNRALGKLSIYGQKNWFAPVASGSNPADAMIVCPCSMGTLAAIAAGLSENLLQRAADVMLKERRKLILVAREMPLSSIHLQNMLKLSLAGAVIFPPCPGFYNHPQSIDDLVNFVVARILDQLHISHELQQAWGAN